MGPGSVLAPCVTLSKPVLGASDDSLSSQPLQDGHLGYLASLAVLTSVLGTQ